MAQRRRSGGRSSSSGSKSSGSSDRKERQKRQKQHEEREDRILGTAPSAPDIRNLKLMEPSEEAKAHQPSDVDAMGQDKRRAVVGHSYGPSRKSQAIFFIAVAAILVVVIGGYALAIAAFDQPPDTYPDKSPWSEANAVQSPPQSPSGPCGEPGNAYPPANDSPCAQGPSSTGEPPSKGTGAARPEASSGGPTAGGAESEPQEPPGN